MLRSVLEQAKGWIDEMLRVDLTAPPKHPTRHIRYDHLKPAVSQVCFGRSRLESQRWVAFRSPYGFDAFYCRPGVEGAHEKGGVEHEARVLPASPVARARCAPRHAVGGGPFRTLAACGCAPL